MGVGTAVKGSPWILNEWWYLLTSERLWSYFYYLDPIDTVSLV